VSSGSPVPCPGMNSRAIQGAWPPGLLAEASSVRRLYPLSPLRAPSIARGFTPVVFGSGKNVARPSLACPGPACPGPARPARVWPRACGATRFGGIYQALMSPDSKPSEKISLPATPPVTTRAKVCGPCGALKALTRAV